MVVVQRVVVALASHRAWVGSGRQGEQVSGTCVSVPHLAGPFQELKLSALSARLGGFPRPRASALRGRCVVCWREVEPS